MDQTLEECNEFKKNDKIISTEICLEPNITYGFSITKRIIDSGIRLVTVGVVMKALELI